MDKEWHERKSRDPTRNPRTPTLVQRGGGNPKQDKKSEQKTREMRKHWEDLVDVKYSGNGRSQRRTCQGEARSKYTERVVLLTCRLTIYKYGIRLYIPYLTFLFFLSCSNVSTLSY